MSDQADFIPAATVMIVRDTADGPEVFMVVRHHEIDFASGALVFPGGKVDKADTVPQLRAWCANPDTFSADELAFRVAVIRESFEECGILLAREKGDRDFIPAERLTRLEDWRDRFNNRDATMLGFVEAENLELAVDTLGHFAHWKTPSMMKKRFDTHFYLVRAPHGHIGLHDGSESVDSIWVRPQQAMDDADAKKRTVIFPTRMNLQKLAAHKDVADAIANCGNVVTVQPFIEKDGDKSFLRIQPEAGYGDPREDVSRGL